MAIVDVVKYNGDPDVFAWKYPNEELGSWTQLIVNESQEAILVKSGKVLDIFGSGRHTLETANIPFLKKLINLPFGRKSPFTAEIWYINKGYNLDIKWGTSSPIQIQDPTHGIFIPVRANGIFSMRISNSKKFFIKLVAALPTFDKVKISNYFKGIYITKVKDVISSYFIKEKISFLEINNYMDELSKKLKEAIYPIMDDYGVELVSFYVNDINVPEDDIGVETLKKALAKRAEMNIIGYNYQQERSFDALEGAAKNPNSSSASLMGAGMGLGMGVGVGSGLGDVFGSIAKEIKIASSETNTKECPNCHARILQTQRFCSNCGFDTENKQNTSIVSKLKCPKCNAQIKNTDKFCPECGEKL